MIEFNKKKYTETIELREYNNYCSLENSTNRIKAIFISEELETNENK